MESDPTVLYHWDHQTMMSPGPGEISMELGSLWNRTLWDKYSIPYHCVSTVTWAHGWWVETLSMWNRNGPSMQNQNGILIWNGIDSV